MIQRKARLKRYTPLNKVARKQQQRINKYRPVKKKFLEQHTECAVCGKPSTQIHHGKGKTAGLLYDTDYFIAVCDGPCHLFLETHPAEAKRLGLSFNRLNNQL